MAHEHAHGHPHAGHGHVPADQAGHLAELLDLDAEVLHDHLTGVMSWIGGQVTPTRILDLGAGTGTGSIALARQFPDASLIALDASAQMLDHLARQAHRNGLGDRIHPVQADLDTVWPALDPVDLVWASASLHHLADPDRVLTDVFATVRPGGLFVVAEQDSFPRFLPAGAAGGLEERLHAVLADKRAHDMPHMGDDWGARLTKAGFNVESARVAEIHLVAPLPPAAGRYAEATLSRLRHGLAAELLDEDRQALDSLVAEIAHRSDLTIRATRPLWSARRP
jgi:SAM-dependent methyltransferase